MPYYSPSARRRGLPSQIELSARHRFSGEKMTDTAHQDGVVGLAKTIVRELITKPYWDEALRSQFIHPLDERNVPLGRMKSALRATSPEETAFSSFIEHVYRGHTANPNSEVAIAKLKATYHDRDEYF